MITKGKIGGKIRELRTRVGFSQAKLGRAIGRTHATISDIERGRKEPTFSELSKIVEVLDASIADFFELSNSYKLFIHDGRADTVQLDSGGNNIVKIENKNITQNQYKSNFLLK